jgi:hypothetical protein
MNLGIHRRWEAGLVMAAAAVVAGVFLASGRFDVGMDIRVSMLFEKNYHVGAPIYGGGKGEVLSGGWTRTAQGLKLQPGQSGRILAPLKKADQDARLVVKVRGRSGPGFHLAVLVSADGRAFREVRQGTLRDGMRVEFTPAAGKGERLWIQLIARMDPAASPAESGTLTEIRIFSTGPYAFPNIALACLFVSIPLLAYAVLSKGRPERALLYSLGLLCGEAILSGTITWTDPAYLCGTTRYLWWLAPLIQDPGCEMYYVVPYGILLGLLAWHVRIGSGSVEARKQWAGFALLGILAWGGSLRLEQLVQVSGLPLEPDADYFRYLADAMRSPYDTTWREPLWVWIVKGLTWLGGTSTLSLRLLTVALSLFVVYSAYKLFSDYTRQPIVGLLAALLLSLNPYLARMSVRGMREEVYTILILWLVYFVFVRHTGLSKAWRAAGLALTSAGILLVRMHGWVFVMPLLLVGSWKNALETGWRRWLQLAAALAFVVLAVAPHALTMYRTYGDPFYSMTLPAIWSRNYEFVVIRHVGCTGCPTLKEFSENSFAGSSLSIREYIWDMHTVQEIADGLTQGYLYLYLLPTHLFAFQSGTNSWPAYLAYLVGLALVLRGSYREMLAVVVLLINGIPLLLMLGHEPRIGIHTAPFVAFVLAWGLWQCIEGSGSLCMTLRERLEAFSRGVRPPAPQGETGHAHRNRLF